MKITTNYSKSDFILLSKTILIHFIIVLIPLLVFVDLILIPYLDEFLIWMPLYMESDLLSKYTETTFEVLTSADVDDLSEFEITKKIFTVMLFSFYGTVIAPAFILLVPIYFWVCYTPSFANWICKKLKCNLMMQLIIFKDGKPCFQKKVKKIE